jgi:hypothetical protein
VQGVACELLSAEFATLTIKHHGCCARSVRHLVFEPNANDDTATGPRCGAPTGGVWGTIDEITRASDRPDASVLPSRFKINFAPPRSHHQYSEHRARQHG